MTKIEWTDKSWNPIRARNRETGAVGHFCVHASPGCEHCYAESWQARLGVGKDIRFAAQDVRKVDIYLDEKVLEQPLRWRKPRMVFVCSMTDFFWLGHSDAVIRRVWEVMARAHRERGHVFQVLTKRPKRIREVLGPRGIGWYAKEGPVPEPQPGIWLGASVEDRRRLRRIDDLRETPAAVRFLSIEPLLEDLGYIDLDGISWVIVGGESGRGARPMHPDWARSIRDQCQAAGVPYFHKQNGEWELVTPSSRLKNMKTQNMGMDVAAHKRLMIRVGKKKTGRLLDGREWNEMPAVAT